MKTRKEIQEIIDAINFLKNNASDEQAEQVAILYPEYNENKEYKKGQRVRKNGKTHKIDDDDIREWNERRNRTVEE